MRICKEVNEYTTNKKEHLRVRRWIMIVPKWYTSAHLNSTNKEETQDQYWLPIMAVFTMIRAKDPQKARSNIHKRPKAAQQHNDCPYGFMPPIKAQHCATQSRREPALTELWQNKSWEWMSKPNGAMTQKQALNTSYWREYWRPMNYLVQMATWQGNQPQ